MRRNALLRELVLRLGEPGRCRSLEEHVVHLPCNMVQCDVQLCNMLQCNGLGEPGRCRSLEEHAHDTPEQRGQGRATGLRAEQRREDAALANTRCGEGFGKGGGSTRRALASGGTDAACSDD